MVFFKYSLAPNMFDVEVVPGAGGLEANMFADELFQFYLGYTADLGFTTNIQGTQGDLKA